MEALVEYIARNLVDDPEQVRVKRRDSGATVVVELKVAQGDAGRIIGRGGRVADAIRTLLQAQESDLQGKRVLLKIS